MLEISGYQLFEKIYQGRNSVIYRGMKLKDDQQSIIIKLPTTRLPDTQGADQLRHEWEMRQQVNSKYVVQYQALEPDATYGCILIEEDDQAEDLTHYIPDTGFEIATFLDIALQLAKGLHEIHQSNIVHNDIKPSNVIFQPTTGKAKYIDFGSAFPLHQIKQCTISPHVSGGTLSYLSPEQTGRTNRLLDYRTDFYSLGVTFYQLLCGRLPFEVKGISQLIHCHIAKQPIPPHIRKDSIPLPLSEIVMKLLSKNAEDRYQSAQGIFVDLKKCAEDLKTKKEIVPFRLAQQDIPERFYLPQKLYGREPELAQIIQTFDRIITLGGKPEVIAIAGPAGTGKSVLVDEIQPMIVAKKGYFLKGKFDQANRNIAYSAISQAIQSWVKQVLLVCSEEEILTWKAQLLTALRNQGQLLIDVMPHLEWIIGKQSPLPPLDPEQTKNRLHWIFQQFITVLTQPAHPLVVFLDDWQWADAASLALLETLITNPDTQYLLLIGAYRDSEVDALHPALLTLQAMQKAGITVQMIPLSPLTESSVNQWVVEAVHSLPDRTHPLTALLYQKTEGNPFFTKAFLQVLYERQLLTLTKEGWQWDLNKIRQLPATENVIEFMAHQIQRLPAKAQDIIKQASCLGHRFTLNTLQQLTRLPSAQLSTELHTLVDSGLLLQTDEDFQFVHDRIQEAAYGLIALEERAPLHLAIGRLLQASLPAEPTLKQEFEVTDHLNQGNRLITDLHEQLALAQLNLKTAQRAKAAAAYATALSYLHAGESYLATIGSNRIWQEHYTLAYNFYKTLAEVEYLNGHFEASANSMDLVLSHAQTVLEKVEIYILRIMQKTVMAHYQEAIDTGYQALGLLGINLQAHDLPHLLQIESHQVTENLKNKTMQELLEAPFMTDATIKARMKLLDHLIASSYLRNLSLHALITAMMMNLTLRYGNSEESAVGYSSYGLQLIAKSNEMQLGYEFGLLAIQLSDRFHHPTSQCRTNFVQGAMLHSWRKPLRQVGVYFDRGQQVGLETGDFQHLGYILQAKAICFFYQGTPLTVIEPELNKYSRLLYVRANQLAAGNIQALQLVILNLREQTPAETAFQDGVKTDVDYQADWQQQKNFYVLTHYFIFKAQALYLHGQFEKALAVLLSAQPDLAFIACNIAVSAQKFYHSLVLAALYPTVETNTQQHYWQQLEANQAQMKIWADNCPENFLHKYLLVTAEMARIQGKDREAADQYDQAIRAAQEQDFIQDYALACELAARFWLSNQRSRCAQTYLDDAYNSYSQWGAKRKVAMLIRQYPEFLKPAVASHLSSFSISSEETIKASSLVLIDLTSVLKASQMISSEIELSKLLLQMMQVMIENAGAQTGAFWLAEADTLWLQADYSLEGRIQTLQKLPLAQWEKGPRSLIDYVKRTQQPVVLGDASHDPQFSQDPYFSAHHTRSVLCMPLIRQKQLKGILYLENNLLSYAFTEQHQQILTLLASQTVISLENAILFESTRSMTVRLNLALQSGNVGTWTWNIRENKVIWDEATYTLFGVNKQEFTNTYESFLALVHPEDRLNVDQALKRTMTENAPYNTEYRIIKPNDQSVHVMLAQGKVYHDDQGQLERILGVVGDITLRKRLEEERFQALQQAEEKERLRAEEAERHRKEQEEFIDTVCHEIRNPMSGIYGSVDFLKQTAESLKTLRDILPLYTQLTVEETLCKLEESIYVIEQCVKHQKTIIDDVLDMSKLEAGKVVLALKPFRPKNLIEDTLRMYAAPLAAKQLTLQLLLPEQTIAIQGDPDRFNMILMNLISNAIKFTEQGHIKVSLQTQAINPTQVALTLHVEDTGVGMTQEQQAQLFQRFSRPISSQYTEGWGLGLTITKKIVDLMGGTIQVESESGRGSKFVVHLTCHSVASEEMRSSPLNSKKRPHSESSEISNYDDHNHSKGESDSQVNINNQTPSKKLAAVQLPVPLKQHILVVEDNLINQRILKRQLEQAGYQCTVANHGQEAVEKYQQVAFDLIFMDREMPVMDGIEATKQIRRREKEQKIAPIPIIGLSAYARNELVEEALAAGMNGYLTKPYEKEKVYEAVKHWTATKPLPERPSHESSALPETVTALNMREGFTTSPSGRLSIMSLPTFWSESSPEMFPAQMTWVPEPLRANLYPILDELAGELSSLGVGIIMPEAKFQDKVSKTGWQLYSVTEQEEYWAVLNLEQAACADKLVEAIQRSGAQLHAKRMKNGPFSCIVMAFSPHIMLSTEVDKIKQALQERYMQILCTPIH